MKKKMREKGFSTIELVTSLFLSTLLILLALPNMQLAKTTYGTISKEEQSYYKGNKIYSLIRDSLNKTSLHLKNYVFHTNGDIKTKEGVPLHFSSQTAPDRNSDAISIFNFSPFDSLARKSGDIFCRISHEPLQTNSNVFLAISSQGAAETIATLTNVSSTFCSGFRAYSVTLSSFPDGLFQPRYFEGTTSEENIFQQSVILIPFREYFTLYVSNQGILRRLGHNKLENNPLEDSFTRMTLNEDENLALEVQFLIKDKEITKYYFFSKKPESSSQLKKFIPSI